MSCGVPYTLNKCPCANIKVPSTMIEKAGAVRNSRISPAPFPPSRWRQLKEQQEGRGHEAGLVQARMEQSSHHQQLAHLQQLRDTIGEPALGGRCVGLGGEQIWAQDYSQTQICGRYTQVYASADGYTQVYPGRYGNGHKTIVWLWIGC